MSGRPIAVVGAGISGLATAWAIDHAGGDVVVLEGGTRVGGVIATEARDGWVVETGPSSLVESAGVARLVAALGLESAVRAPFAAARRRYLVRDGVPRAVASSPPAALASPLVSPLGKLRALAEPLVPARAPDAPEESIAALVRRRFGREVLEAIIDPIVSGVYAGDPERLSARHVFRMLHDLERAHGSVLRGARRLRRTGAPRVARPQPFSFDGGLRRLPDAIAAGLGDRVRRGARVVALRPDDDGWIVRYVDARGSAELAAAAIVLAVPAYALSSIALPIVASDAVRRLAAVPHAPVATVALGFRRDAVAHPLDGFGMLVPGRERMTILGTLFASSVFEGRAPDGYVLLTTFVGGARRPELAHESSDALADRAATAVRALLGARGAPAFVHVTRWAPGIPQYVVGHDAALDAAAAVEQSCAGLVLTGSWRRGVSLGDCIADGLATGARAVTVAARGARASGRAVAAVR